jgi:hypothetical protein
MPAPTALDLRGLFRDPDMFDSNRSWRKAGFDVEGRGDWSNIMVASHPSVQGYLFKKYSAKISLKEQLENYHLRVEGADKLRAFIAAQRLTLIVVPQKLLHELPPEFSRKGVSSYVLVVEKLTLLESSDSKRLFRQLDHEGLRQLCTTLLTFKGLDSGVRNVPFTDKGQIAFVDTERWDEHNKKKIFLRRIREYLSDDQQKVVKKIVKSSEH